MATTVTLPADLAPATTEALRHYPDDPSVQRFFALVGEGRTWSPRVPRLLLALAARYELPISGPRHGVMLLAGFAGRGRVQRVFSAVRELVHARHEGQRTDRLRGEGLLVWEDATHFPDPVAPHLPRPVRIGGAVDAGVQPPAPAPSPPPAEAVSQRPDIVTGV
jgi:hypothetical protein